MVAVIPVRHAFQPRPDVLDRLMHHPAQLLLNNTKFCPHPLGRRMPQTTKWPFVFVPQKCVNPRNVNVLRLPHASLSPIGRCETPEFDQPRFLRMDLQPKLRQPFQKISQKPLSIRPVLKSRDEVVGLADHDHVPLCQLLAPYLDLQVEHIVQVHVCEQRGSHCPLWRTHIRFRPFAVMAMRDLREASVREF